MNPEEVQAMRAAYRRESPAEREKRLEAARAYLPPPPRGDDGKLRNAQDLGDIVRERRRELGLTQVKLADLCQCSPRFISELERGVAGGNIKQVIYVCRQIGIDLYAKPRR